MRIGELAKRTGCGVETVRYYEREGLLEAPQRDASGYRAYGPRHLETLQFARHCRSLGMKLTEIRQLLDFRRHPEGDCAGVNDLLDLQIVQVERQIAAMATLKEQLLLLRGTCAERRTNGKCGILRSLDDAARGAPCPCHGEASQPVAAAGGCVVDWRIDEAFASNAVNPDH
ncbi:MAG: Cd(II)/Pb(II)-responsive transcriptional regulator [Magnetococcales bacterium]|nr:Cd(II)/Pb(II)-responsive transcriptional regulator [Magnetococcales bacterium]